MNMYFFTHKCPPGSSFFKASSLSAKCNELQKECFHMHRAIGSPSFFLLPALHLLLYTTNKCCCFLSPSQTFLHISPHSGLVYQTPRHFLTYGLFLTKMSCIYISNCNCCTCSEMICHFKHISKRQLIFYLT